MLDRDAVAFRSDMEWIRALGARLLNHHFVLPNVEQTTIAETGINPTTLWSVP